MSRERNRVLPGEIDLGRVFLTFTEYADQKIRHGLIFEALLRGLKDQGVVLIEEQPTTLLDLGCGDGQTACEMIDAVNRVHPRGAGVNYYGLDADERFVLSTQQLLAKVRTTKRLDTIQVQQADLLDGNALPFGPLDRVLATIGHLLYYAGSDLGRKQTKRNIALVVNAVANVLGRDGIALFAHSADHCPLANLRAQVADSVEAKPANMIAAVAEEMRLDLLSLLVPFKVYFPASTEQQWAACKAPPADEPHRSATEFVDTLELLTFIAQRELKGLTRRQRNRLIDDLRSLLDADGALVSWSNYQVLLSRTQSSGLRESAAAALRKVEDSLDRIVRKSEAAFRRRSGVSARFPDTKR